jgi:hypothetical protein
VIVRWERVLVLAPHTDDGEFGCGVSGTGEGEGGNFPRAKEPSSEVLP